MYGRAFFPQRFVTESTESYVNILVIHVIVIYPLGKQIKLVIHFFSLIYNSFYLFILAFIYLFIRWFLYSSF